MYVCKLSAFCVRFNQNSNISRNFNKNSQHEFSRCQFRCSRIGSCGQNNGGRTEENDEANSRFAKPCL